MSGRRDAYRRGSVLILVVALLAVLFIAGMGFLSMSSVDRRSSAATRFQSTIMCEIDGALRTAIGEMSRDLWGSDNQLLSGNGGNEAWDFPCSGDKWGGAVGQDDDAWLAAILPETVPDGGGVPIPNSPSDPNYQKRFKWRHISNMTGQAMADTDVLASDLDADADCDGINDSRFVLSPSGRYRLAWRVVDTNAMINLNTAGRGFPDDQGTSSVHVAADYANGTGNFDRDNTFLWYVNVWNDGFRPMWGRGGPVSRGDNGRHSDHDLTYLLDNPLLRTSGERLNAALFHTYDMLTHVSYGIKPGPVVPRYSSGMGNTFSSGRKYCPDIKNIAQIDPDMLTGTGSLSMNMFFSTYGWVRNARSARPPSGPVPQATGVTTWNAWKAIARSYCPDSVKVSINGELGSTNLANPSALVGPFGSNSAEANIHHSTYTRALMAAIVLSGVVDPNPAHFVPDAGYSLTTRQAQQLVVNLVDWRDAYSVPSRARSNAGNSTDLVDTVWNTPGIYGNEPQIFFTEIAVDTATAGGPYYAVELFNPYAWPISLHGANPQRPKWRLKDAVGTLIDLQGPTSGIDIPGGGRLIVTNQDVNAPPQYWPVNWNQAVGGDPNATAVWDRLASSGTRTLKVTKSNLVAGPGMELQTKCIGDSAWLTIDKVAATGLPPTPDATVQPYWNLANRWSVQRGDLRWQQTQDKWYLTADTDKVWTTGTAYAVGDLVCTLLSGGDGKIWVCKQAHTAQAAHRTGTTPNFVLNATYWADTLARPQSFGTFNWSTLSTNRNYRNPTSDNPTAGGRWGVALPIPGSTAEVWTRSQTMYRNFLTAGQLNQLMLYGPSNLQADGSTKPLADLINTAGAGTTADVEALYLDLGSPTKGLYRVLRTLGRLDRRVMNKGVYTAPYAAVDWNVNGRVGVTDDEEARLPGLININTAPPFVLRYLNYWMFPRQTVGSIDVNGLEWGPNWGYLQNKGYEPPNFTSSSSKGTSNADCPWPLDIYNYRESANPPGFRDDAGAVALVSSVASPSLMKSMLDKCYFFTGWTQYCPRVQRSDIGFYWDPYLNGGIANSLNWTPIQSTTHPSATSYANPNEKHFLFDRISDLITTRSDTFLVYVLVESVATNQPPDRRRMVAIIDRSRCCAPPTTAAWTPGSSYTPGTWVTQNGMAWLCRTAHTAGATLAASAWWPAVPLSPEVVARSITTW